MKITIIGGGRVGSSTAYALQLSGVGSEIALVDANLQLAQGEALDLMHGAAFVAPQRIVAGTIAEQVPNSQIIIITAGSRRAPNESRLDLINRNISIFRSILQDIRQVGHPADCKFIIVSNPVDILTYLAVKEMKVAANQVIGLGTVLDTLRFCSLLGHYLQVAANQVSGLILGEHGDSMVPIWSATTIGASPIHKWPKFTANLENEIFERTRNGGAEAIKLKGGSGYSVGIAIMAVVRAIVNDTQELLPVSTFQTGKYGFHDVCISIPTKVGRAGVLETFEIDFWPKEKMALQKSYQTLRESIKNLQSSKG